MSLILKIALLAVAAAILSSLLKESRPEYVLLLELCFVVVVAAFVISFASKKIAGLFENTFDGLVDGKYISIMLKGALVSVSSSVCASLCRESGNRALGDIVEISGRVIIIMFSIPLIESVVETALVYVK